MSSILRALKKLDEESASGSQTAGGHHIDMKEVVHRRSASPWSGSRIMVVFAVVLFMAVAGWLLLNPPWNPSVTEPSPPAEPTRAQTPPPGQPVNAASMPPSAEASPVPSPPPAAVAGQHQKAGSSSRSSAPPGESAPIAKEPVSPKPASRGTLPTPANETGRPRPPARRPAPASGSLPVPPRVMTAGKDARRLLETAPQPPGEKSPPTREANRALQPPAPKKTANTARPGFNLGGVIWSENPARRLAIINDRYVKEGDKVKGATVVRIEKKSVTLKQDEDTWTIRM